MTVKELNSKGVKQYIYIIYIYKGDNQYIYKGDKQYIYKGVYLTVKKEIIVVEKERTCN